MDQFIARQPIFDRKRNVLGYEILFRSGPDNFFLADDGDLATRRVISESLDGFGIDRLTGGRRAFINVSRRVLTEGSIRVLPSALVVVEILETIEVDEEVLSACRRLRAAGYPIALDDFDRADGSPLIAMADIIKVDFLRADPAERRRLAERYLPRGIKLLAEKVETHEDFREAVELGYTWFQGYFFCRPEVISRRSIPVVRQNYLHFLAAVNDPGLDPVKLEPVIRRDVSLTVRLLRLLNSAYFGLSTTVTSVQHALMLLGRENLRRWASLLALMALAEDKPSELLTAALVRARFCELLGATVDPGRRSEDLFLTGLLSTLDALTDRTMEEILPEIPVSNDIKAALLGRDTPLGRILALALAGERGDWEAFARFCAVLGIAEEGTPPIYCEAVQWADDLPRAA